MPLSPPPVLQAPSLADIRAADRDGDDLRGGGIGRTTGFVEVPELAGAGEQARNVGFAGDDQRVVREGSRH